ncbi:MAG: hypothetical protein QW763_05695 [Archaeoglobaceae archaeon]
MKGARKSVFSRPVEQAVLRKQNNYRYEKLNSLLPPSRAFVDEEQAARNLLLALLSASETEPQARQKDVR